MAYKDPERQKAYAREWLKRFPGKARAAAKRWNQANPERRLQQHRKDRAKRARIAGSLTAEQWRQLLRSHGERCGYCGATGPLHADHRTPLCRGGAHHVANIIPACARCNLTKGRLTEREFRVRLANERMRSPDFVVVDWWPAGEIHCVS